VVGVQILQVTSNLVVFLLLARVLGKELLGQYYLLFALVWVVQLLLEGGVSTVLTRRLAQTPGRWREVAAEAGGVFGIIITASFSVFVLMGAVWAWWRGDTSLVVSFAAAGVACAALQGQRYCEGVLQGLEQFGCASVAGTVQGLLYVLLVILLALWGEIGLKNVMLVFAGSQLAGALWLMAGLRRRWPDWSCGVSLRRFKEWLCESFPLGVGDIVRGPNWQLDTIWLGLFEPAAAVGLYVVALRPHAPLLCFPRAVLTAAFPMFARLAAGQPAALERAFSASVRLLWLAGLPLTIAVCLCAEFLITVLVGREYLDAAPLMRIVIWKTGLAFLSIQFRFLFAAVGRQHTYARLVLRVFVLEAILELLLILWLGSLGACVGCVLGEAALAAGGLLICRHLGIRGLDWRALGGALVAGTVMAIAFWAPSRQNGFWLPVAAVLSIGLYFVSCFLLGVIRREEPGDIARAVAGWLRRGESRSLTTADSA
jgi:O-antigen/teichoic acid export membrane protein